jgi:hypothetical protein
MWWSGHAGGAAISAEIALDVPLSWSDWMTMQRLVCQLPPLAGLKQYEVSTIWPLQPPY